MKKIISIVLSLVLLSGIYITPVLANDEITVLLNGEKLIFDVLPQMINNRTMVPMRKIFESMGADVEWNGDTKTITATKDEITVIMQINNHIISVNEDNVTLDVPPQLVNNRTLVPVRAVAEGLEAKVEWDGESRTVIITSKSDAINNGADGYDMSELSPNDIQALRALEGEYRYLFEQEILPGEILLEDVDITPYIENKSEELSNIIYEIWDTGLASVILDLQMNSEDSYVFDASKNLTESEIVENYIGIAKGLGMDSVSNFNVSYDTTPANKTVLLLSFVDKNYDNPMLIVSRYIAIVSDNGKSRYFTAEISPIGAELLGYDVWMGCEITLSGRKNYGTLEETTKEAFLKKIDYVIDNNVDM